MNQFNTQNNMKKLAITTIGVASAASLSAQSLFDLAPADDASESIPLSWTLSAGIGTDDNPTPLGGSDSTLYGSASIGASFLSVAPQTRTEFFARLGTIHYFDDLDYITNAGVISVDQSTTTYGFGLNWTREVNERLRLVSRTYLSQELEPDRASGIGGLMQVGSYQRWNTNLSVGYRWSERLGTYTGLTVSDLSYDNFGQNEFSSVSIYNDFRYQLSPQTVATLTYRHVENDVLFGGDSTNQHILAGLEHRFSPNTIGVVRAGAQFRDIDGSANGTTTSPNLEASLNNRINEQLTVRAYARYSNEDYVRSVAGGIYDNAETLRLGLSASYMISPTFSINAGLNYQDVDYSERATPFGPIDPTEDIVNYFVGFNMSVTDTISLYGTYNHEDFGSSVAGREFDRNRLSLGVSSQF